MLPVTQTPYSRVIPSAARNCIEGPGQIDSNMSFYAYILKCSDGSYYTGQTDDLDRRLAEHQTGLIPEYTKGRRPVHLAWCQQFSTRGEAKSAEFQIKPWNRGKKETLIAGNFQLLSAASKKKNWDNYRQRRGS